MSAPPTSQKLPLLVDGYDFDGDSARANPNCAVVVHCVERDRTRDPAAVQLSAEPIDRDSLRLVDLSSGTDSIKHESAIDSGTRSDDVGDADDDDDDDDDDDEYYDDEEDFKGQVGGELSQKLEQAARDAFLASAHVTNTSSTISSLLDRLPSELVGLATLKSASDRLAELPLVSRTTFVVRGPAGHGKSTLINSILGEAILPISSNEACTTVPTRILHSPSPDLYRAEVSFISLTEWVSELKAYCTARLQGVFTPPGSPTVTSPIAAAQPVFSFDATVAKLNVLYDGTDWGELTEDQCDCTPTGILERDAQLRGLLGTTTHLRETSAEELSRKLRQFDDPRTSRVWPLVKEIRVYIHSKPLEHGATLIDLPGTGDCNAARNEAAARYVQDYDFMWVCLDLCRAKSNREMAEVFATLSDEQLRSGRGRISFVLTKSEQGCKILDRPLEAIHQDVSALRDDAEFADTHQRYRDVVSMIQDRQTGIRMTRSRQAQPQRKKRRRTEKQSEGLDELIDERRELKQQLALTYCKARSQAVEAAITERYHQMTHKLIHRLHGDEEDVKASAGLAKLVYSTATQDFEALMTRDVDEVVFATCEKDTGVPDLRHLLFWTSCRDRISCALSRLHSTLLMSTEVLMLTEPSAYLDASERKALAQRWGPSRPAGQLSISETLELEFEQSIRRIFKRLEAEMIQQSTELLESRQIELRQELGCRWFRLAETRHPVVIRSALKGGGVHPAGQLDINAELSTEFIKLFESTWNETIGNYVHSLRCDIACTLRRFMHDTVDAHLSAPMRLALSESIAQSQDELTRQLQVTIQRFQRQSRSDRIDALNAVIAPKIASKLRRAYAEAALYAGRGSVARRRDRISYEVRNQVRLFDCTPDDFDIPAMVRAMRDRVRTPILDLARCLEDTLVRFSQTGGCDFSSLEAQQKEDLESLRANALELQNFASRTLVSLQQAIA
ncbi:uncharacterized protein PFL1_01105 [Pseudozyma flocculosa PF-1]|uniref:G domain-containing protein n=1 Tax=Pseudozyma flocculosa TaxID=84751 RepID=A0A5C3FDX1_9BASI|nr:uncharacterized protein PFL1_01105 [Pseudozyma flocculosa PF-1]EPQ31773.1 hypothetical protein PFL1_01105 [Pseudozyma flocculosa PF-1]SPO41837.1 uncharacterized protein PSFLO_07319 [Pseudozyma flocculosa]